MIAILFALYMFITVNSIRTALFCKNNSFDVVPFAISLNGSNKNGGLFFCSPVAERVPVTAVPRKKSIFKGTEHGYPGNLWRIEIEVSPIAINLDLYGDPSHVLYGYIRPLSSPSTSALSRYTLFIFPSWPPRRGIHRLFSLSFHSLFFLFAAARPLEICRKIANVYFHRFAHCVSPSARGGGAKVVAEVATRVIRFVGLLDRVHDSGTNCISQKLCRFAAGYQDLRLEIHTTNN